MLPFACKKSGSITLMVLMAIVALSLCAYGLLSTCSYSLLLAYQREEYEKHYHILRAVHEHGMVEYGKKKNMLFTLKTSIPSEKNISYEGITHVKQTKKQVTVYTDLKKGGKIVASTSSIITDVSH